MLSLSKVHHYFLIYLYNTKGAKTVALHPQTHIPLLSNTALSTLSASVAYISVGFTNYPVTVELINELLICLIRAVNWLRPSNAIPP